MQSLLSTIANNNRLKEINNRIRLKTISKNFWEDVKVQNVFHWKFQGLKQGISEGLSKKRISKRGFMILEFAVSHGIIWLLVHHKRKHSSMAVQSNDAHIPIPKFGD